MKYVNWERLYKKIREKLCIIYMGYYANITRGIQSIEAWVLNIKHVPLPGWKQEKMASHFLEWEVTLNQMQNYAY